MIKRGFVGGMLVAAAMALAGCGSAEVGVDPNAPGQPTKDPVCGTELVIEDGMAHLDHEGQRYHFCGQVCAGKFETDPSGFLTPR